MPDQLPQTTALSAPVIVEQQPTPGTPSWWAQLVSKLTPNQLLVLILVGACVYFFYDLSQSKKNEREDKKIADERAQRIQQEEQERNRQSAAERDRIQREWSQFENDRTRRSIDENTKAVLTFNGNAVRLEQAVNALVRRLEHGREPADPCESLPWWERLRDVAVPNNDLPIDRRGSPMSVSYHARHGAGDGHGAGVVGRWT